MTEVSIVDDVMMAVSLADVRLGCLSQLGVVKLIMQQLIDYLEGQWYFSSMYLL